MAHTYAVLTVSDSTYKEIRMLLQAAGYEHAVCADDIYGELIYMRGIALGNHDREEITEKES